MAKIDGPDFITLLVRDLEVSRRFYKETLGLPESEEKHPNAQGFATSPCGIAIRKAADVPDHPGQGIIGWLRTSEGAELYAGLKQRGVEIAEELRKSPFGMIFSFRDRDGYVITVHDAG